MERKQQGIHSDAKPEETQQPMGSPQRQRFSDPRKKSQPTGKKIEETKKESDAPRRRKKREGVADVEPKVFEPYEPIPGRQPRSVVVERKRKHFESHDVQRMLKDVGIDYSRPINAWLPIEPFDNFNFDERLPSEWIEFCHAAGTEDPEGVPAIGLYHDPTDETVGKWLPCLIYTYEEDMNVYRGVWEDNKGPLELPKIHLMFISEDPTKFVSRVQQAHQRRTYAESLIRYNFYIDNMPIEEIPPLDSLQKSRLLFKATNVKHMEKNHNPENSPLITETNLDFARTMNKIIFDKHMKEAGRELISRNLTLPPAPALEDAPQYGMVQIPDHDFPGNYNVFNINSLYVRDESISAIELIRKECNATTERELFTTTFTQTLRLEEFKQIEQGAISQILFALKTWVSNLVDIIRTSFQDMGATLFNLHCTSRDQYNTGKLKKFLVMCKLMMQDCLFNLTYNSCYKFIDVLETFIPAETVVTSPCNVSNTFALTADQLKNDAEWARANPPIPLFALDILKGADKFVYSTDPTLFITRVVEVFQDGIKGVKDVGQLEEIIMPNLFKAQGGKTPLKAPVIPGEEPAEPTLEEKNKGMLPDENIWVWEIRERIRILFEAAIKPLYEYLETYDQFDKVLALNADAYVEELKEEDPPRELMEIRDEIYSHMEKEKEMLNSVPEVISVSCFQIHCKEARSVLAGKHSKFVTALTELIAQRSRDDNIKLLETFREMQSQLNKKATDIEELTKIKDLMNRVPLEIQRMQVQIDENLTNFGVLEKFSYRFSKDDIEKRWEVFGAPKKTMNIIDKRIDDLEKGKQEFEQAMIVEQSDFYEAVDELDNIVKGFSQYTDIEQFEEYAKMAESVNQRLEDATNQARIFNHREGLFGRDITDYSQLHGATKEFKPYSDLWINTRSWFNRHSAWLVDEWEELDGNEIENTVDNVGKTLSSCQRYYRNKDNQPLLAIVEKVKLEVDEFRQYVPMAVALRKPGMRDRHWDQITEKVGFEVRPTEGFTLTKCIDMGLSLHEDTCVEVGERAAKEFTIEKSLNHMEAEWEPIEFVVLPAKNNPDTSILGGFDIIQQQLDDHIVQAQAMQFSAFKKPFEERIDEWVRILMVIQDIIEEWGKCQVSWMYLSPIFDSKDIMKQLPAETKKFKNVDTIWKQTMSKVKAVPSTMKTCKVEGRLDVLRDCNKNLDLVHKGLSNYLETKRGAFSRFYFLSDEELLSILSETKDPTLVQPHLRKVFENINSLAFDENKIITSMSSGEGECCPFIAHLDPKSKNVEYWMCDVEDMMKQSVRHQVMIAIKEYPTISRNDWVLKHLGQCVLNCSQVHWTIEVEEAINGGVAKVQEYLDKVEEQLLATVDLVRTKLTKLQSITLGALIVIDVHAKDVIADLVKAEISNPDDFEWSSQLRYYWDPEEDDLYVRCIQTNYPYGYEYLGNTLRLVITPLTDRCYITLMGALNLNLGGAPAGPAGTGKTESTKDLAKALAKQCVVFNCSDSMDYIMVGKMFKGLASAGAWCCFDEFNRIHVEVLSVIAQQLLQLLAAKAEGLEECDFEGSTIRVSQTFCVFITMNPGYAGRTELPDNLKALFRPMAMMVPDYALIGKIMLYSFGFTKAPVLAVKMVVTFKLSSEQLSAQDHYDYGMRAVRSVINAAGLIKRANPDMDEDQLLLRALRDVNVPKFLKDDLPLFENIILDLFPGVEKPVIDRGQLGDAIIEISRKNHLQATEVFCEKVVQLYDTICVRHGLMLVGPTGGGKTSNIHVLGQAMTSLHELEDFDKVFFHTLNPKSITMGQLYGQADDLTHEWTDGIVANLIRLCVRDQHVEPFTNKHWVIFDGPVDSLWIESMNTVLDDNKKLCLNSGEIIPLSQHMTMMFEVEDLAVASPATVSRCGMVYMEPGALGLQPLVDTWHEKLDHHLTAHEGIMAQLQDMYNVYTEPAIKFVRKNLSEPVTSIDNNLCQSVQKIMNCFFEDYKDTEIRDITPEEIEELYSILENLYIYAVTWSVGATCTLDGRKKFGSFLKDIIDQRTLNTAFPETETVYDWCFNLKEKKYILWNDTITHTEIDDRVPFAEVSVPTVDSIRIKFLYKLLLMNRYHVLSPGPTATGKSVNCESLMQSEMPENYQSTTITFSARTSANLTQDMIDSKVARRKKDTNGPPPGKYMIVFVDDLNMPKKEEYGAQPPIEVIRQWMDHGGWFNRKEMTFLNIVDIVYLSAMGPPGGGRSFITNRLLRHFNLVTYCELEDHDVKMIFNTKLSAYLKAFVPEVQETVVKVTDATLALYKNVEIEMLPTPSRSHYTFNLRDMANVIQGMASSHPKAIENSSTFIKLWAHEFEREFGDRLISVEDRGWLREQTRLQITETFESSPDVTYENARLIFGDFLIPGAEPRIYAEIDDMKKFIGIIDEYLEGYNDRNKKKQMKLVMFLDACTHVSRICRILRQPRGNALCLGVGGSGRQSLCKLAAYVVEYEIHQIEITKSYNMTMWHDDLKEVLKYAGLKNEPVCFLFVDTQIINEQMLEDLNNILNSADVPNIYKIEDKEEINDVGRTECQRRNLQPNEMNMMNMYLLRVKKNIHMLLAMSPIGELFRSRLRMFPSLINCCTTNWFTEWPEEALVSVAKGAIDEEEMQLDNQYESIIQMFKIIHQSVEQKSLTYWDELRRMNYVTPTSYLELLNCFKSLLDGQRKLVCTKRDRLQVGLDKLAKAQEDVAILQVELTEMKPQLAKDSEEAEKMVARIEIDKKEADETQKKVALEEAEAQRKTDEAEALQNQAAGELAAALPALEAAVKCVNSLNKNQIVEVKSMLKPPSGVKLCMEVVCIMFDVPPKMEADPDTPGKKIANYWDAAKAQVLNNDKKLLNDLVNYDKENISVQKINKLTPYIQNPEFAPAKIRTASIACEAMAMWAHAMHKFYHVNKQVEPLKVKLKEVEAELTIMRGQLESARARLKEVTDQIEALEKSYADTCAKMEYLKNSINDCELKLERAGRLIGGLGGEAVRWTEEVAANNARLELLPGDVVIAAGMVGYAGAFTSDYRKAFESSWVQELDRLNVVHSPGVCMRETLGDDVLLQQWKVAGLPSDSVSIENGIIIFTARRWPLMIDPQKQANRFIKNLGKEWDAGIDIAKASDPNLIRNLGTAIMNGKYLLMENAPEELEPALEPLLTQQKHKEGSVWNMRLGDKSYEYNEDFRFFITTTLPNPHYSPETTVKVSILNFAITPEGLEEQMLATVVALESPQLEETKNLLVIQNAKSKKELFDIESKILYLLAHAEGNVLEDEELINTLAASKQTSAEIQIKVKEAAATEIEIDAARESYRPVAFRASLLFFCIVDLSSVDPMYQYSLQWFTKLFMMGIENAAPSNVHEERLQNLSDYFTYSLYENICRSLFSRHKLLFSFTLAVKILAGDNLMDPHEWRYFLAGPSGESHLPPNPTTWLTDSTWQTMYEEVHGAESLKCFEGFEKFFLANIDDFKTIFDAVNAHETPIPGEWNEKLNEFHKMIFLKAIRPDKCVPAIQNWVSLKIGQKFIDPPTFSIDKAYKDSGVTIPLIFVLSPGSDPVSAFLRYAEEMGMSKKLESISLGKGMGDRAKAFIEDAKVRGGWVLLQNCHLSISWMPEMERLCEEFDENIHRDFRLWLTSMASPEFPVSVLQNSVKMTVEPPKGLRSNLLLSYSSVDDKILEDCNKPDIYKSLYFAFCFFHAVVQDRRKFGPIGWNIAYEFTTEDLNVTLRQLRIFLNKDTEKIPYKVLNILGAGINYGGRVTDDKDKRLTQTILETFIREETLTSAYKFSTSGKYYSPDPCMHNDYVEFIKDLPLDPSPEAFGLHENAEITTAMNETYTMLEIILNVQPRSSSGGGISREDQITQAAVGIEKQLPPLFDIDEINIQYPTQYTESMNTVLTQEVLRYQTLLDTMVSSLDNVQKAILGKIVMSEDLEKMATSLFDNQVPLIWATVGFLSLKPLASWFNDLLTRVDFLNDWIKNGTPKVFWISGFFFPQAFLTGTLQNYARIKRIAIDRLTFKFNILDDRTKEDITEKPETGCYVYGFYMEGARWDKDIHSIGSSLPKALYDEMPMMHFQPKEDYEKPDEGIYTCPVYKTLQRAGTLSTTGHSTNFVCDVFMPSEDHDSVWIKAGVAMFTALRT